MGRAADAVSELQDHAAGHDAVEQLLGAAQGAVLDGLKISGCGFNAGLIWRRQEMRRQASSGPGG